MSPEAFLGAAPTPLSGNTPWAARYASEIRRVFHDHAARAPRSLQVFLGPSEIGEECDRQVAAKMARLPATNHISDPWPSIRGTALHVWAAEAFDSENERRGYLRWLAEQRVTPHPDHPGTADLYDADEECVGDHKFLGEASMAKVRGPSGPPRKYVVQMLLYAKGYRLLGLPVKRVALIAYPATAGSLDGMYVWERVHTAADDELIAEVFRANDLRRLWAIRLLEGTATLHDVPAVPSHENCAFCLAGETEVVTRDGIRPIRDLAGGEHELLVPSGHGYRGTFRTAPVRSFGKQRLHAVTLQRYRARKVVHATAEHRWVLPGGAVRTTAELTPGTALDSVRAYTANASDMISVGVAQGFTYGDGAVGQGRRPATLSIYGRSAKAAVLEHFGKVSCRDSATPGGDVMSTIYGLPRFWKALPPIDESRAFLLSWLAGYFAADGTVTKDGQPSISSASREALQFVRDVAAVCGVRYGAVTTKMRLGTGTEPTPLHTISLSSRDLPEWFWILPHHAERVEARTATPERTTHWSIVSVEPTDRVEAVYCATVPEVESFGLADGLTTGNCPMYRPSADIDGGPGCSGTSGNL